MERDSPEWVRVWGLLARHTLGQGDTYCQDTGERWQYMGTWDGWHEFRHRHHPKTGRREVVFFQATHR